MRLLDANPRNAGRRTGRRAGMHAERMGGPAGGIANRVAGVVTRVLLCVVAALCVRHTAVAAQQPVSAPRDTTRAARDTVRVDSTAKRLATVVVTGTRLTDVDERIPSQVESMDLQHVSQGPDAAFRSLQQLPGVTLYDDQGTRLQPELEVRGFQISPIVGTPQGVSVFLDGVRVNEPDAQEVNFDLLPMGAIDHSELVRGSQALFGRNSLGGALLFFTQRGTPTPSAGIQLSTGSFGERVGTITAGGMINGIDAFAMGSASNEDGWRQATAARTRQLFVTIGRRSTAGGADTSDIALSLLYAHDRIREAGSLPDSWIAVNPRLNYTPGDFFNPDLIHVALRGFRGAWGGTLRGTLYFRRNDIEQFNVNVPPPSTDAFIDNKSLGATGEWTRPFLLGALPIALTVGAEYARQNVRFRLTNTGGGEPDSVATLAVVHEDDAAAYSQAVLDITPRLSATAALRLDYVRIPFRDELKAANDGTNTYDRLSPFLGLTWKASAALRGFVAYKSAFRAPAPLELACASPVAPCSLPSALGADPALAPVTTHDYEAGFDLDLPNHTSFDVDGFWTVVDNDIVFAAPNLTQVYFVNIPKSRRAGVEISAQTALPAGGRLFGSYSYVASTYQSTVQIATADTNPVPARPGDQIPSSPRHRGRVGVGMTRTIGALAFDAQLDLRAYSSQFLRGDEANRHAPVPGYAVSGFNLNGQYQRYTIQLEIDNLFDRRYQTFGAIAENSLGPPPGQAAPNAGSDEGALANFFTPGLPRRIVLSVGAKF
ncbi:MAG TPA: TonB-dependent receptor [Gemmatimonadaceae bacterium]|nr:TonB-dependent receptor [Gemmatimonadaceae bacterium]